MAHSLVVDSILSYRVFKGFWQIPRNTAYHEMVKKWFLNECMKHASVKCYAYAIIIYAVLEHFMEWS